MGYVFVEKDGVITPLPFPDIYRYKGFVFEWNNYHGPVKLNRDLEPSKRAGHKFYKVVYEWSKLSKSKQQKTMVI